MRRSWLRAAAVVVVLVMIAGAACQAPEPVADLDDLVDRLEAEGAAVEITDRTGRNLHLSVPGRRLIVNGGNVLVFEYEELDRAETEADALNESPGLVFFEEGEIEQGVSEVVSGDQTFFHSGRVILLYVGESDAVLSPLRAVAGRPIR